MYVYADPYSKTCQIIESNDILDAIIITMGKGIIYLTNDTEDDAKDISALSEQEIRDLMSQSVVWKDGILSSLGKTLIDNSNFRNYID